MSSIIVPPTDLATTIFKSPGNDVTNFSFPKGIDDGGGTGLGNGISVTMWGQNPHTRATDQNGTLDVISVVTKLVVTSVDASDGTLRRLGGSNYTENITVSISTPLSKSLAGGDVSGHFKEPKVHQSFLINCTEGIEEIKYVFCPEQTYGIRCDGQEDELNKVDCLTESVVPVCGMYDSVSNSWLTENCFWAEQPMNGLNIVECNCIFDARTVNPDFASMAKTVASSFTSTVVYGVKHLFTPQVVLKNPTMSYTLASMSLLALLLTYRGYQLDQAEKVREKDRLLLDFKIMQKQREHLKKVKKEDRERRMMAIKELKKSSDKKERSRGESMEKEMYEKESREKYEEEIEFLKRSPDYEERAKGLSMEKELNRKKCSMAEDNWNILSHLTKGGEKRREVGACD